MNISFENKRILVTGACQGIGKDVALRLSKYKGTVIGLSNKKEGLEKLKKEDPKIQTLHVELLDWAATREAVKSVLPIDLLVNNAGVIVLGSCLTATEKDFDFTFGVNVKAMLNVSQVVAANMLERKVPGSIVNVSSQTSRAPLHNHINYSMSKAAVNMLTKTMALELGLHNIRVNAVLPTVVMTPLAEVVWDTEEKCREMTSRCPMGRFAKVEEVTDAIVFLLSDRSSMTTGSGLPVDGGFVH